MTKFVAIAYRETVDDYACPETITFVGIFDTQDQAYEHGQKYVQEHTYINSYDVQEVEQ